MIKDDSLSDVITEKVKKTPGGFKRVVVKTVRRLIVSVDAMDKAGKTEFILGSKDRLAFFNLDHGEEGVIEKHLAKGKDIVVPERDYRLDLQKAIDTIIPQEIRKKGDPPIKLDTAFQKHIEDTYTSIKCDLWSALEGNNGVNTVGVDTGTQLYEMSRLALHGRLELVLPKDYDSINMELQSLFDTVGNSNKNFIITHHLKQEWVDNQATNNWVRSGWKGVRKAVQVNVLLWRKHKENDPPDSPSGEFALRINNCRHNEKLAGKILEGEMCNFPFLAVEIFPDTKLEDWGYKI